jgi:ATP:ADP antiporter, AAA family
MHSSIAKWLGFPSMDEFKKFSLLSVIFFLVIGSYWFLRPLKDTIFMAVIGGNYIWMAKMLSLVVVLPLVVIYSKLIEIFPRHRMFYVLATLYGIAALIFAAIMIMPEIGLANAVKSPSRYWGWAWYVYVESFGSLIVALFWAFAADITTPDSARRGYPVVAFGGQFGNILGPLGVVALMHLGGISASIDPEKGISPDLARSSAKILATSVAMVAGLLGLIMVLINYFMKTIPKDQMVGFQAENAAQLEKEEHGTGFFEGIILLFKSPYLLSIFAIITAYEVIVTILDFNFKVMVEDAIPLDVERAKYLGWYGASVGLVSMLSIALGINSIQRFLGLSASLALLPIIVAGAVLAFYIHPVLGTVYWIMVFAKAINYALNQPSMKQLYIPTTTQAKYKSQAFIEMYGSRGSKALGSLANSFRGSMIANMGVIEGFARFVTLSTFISMGIIGFWFLITLYLGSAYNKAVREKRVIV